MKNKSTSPVIMITKAQKISINAHRGQKDKGGVDYYLHPQRVAANCKTTDEKIVALLHDTIEDTSVTAEYLLSEGFSGEIVDAVLSVTKREGESYHDFVLRAGENEIGRVVKINDILDNMDLSRLKTLSDEDLLRNKKYLDALRVLM